MDHLLEAELQIKELEKKILESSKRSLALLHESEAIGVATAQELDDQSKSLARTNVSLHVIKNNLKSSHKHLKGMNSLFLAWKSQFSDKFHKTPNEIQACSSKLSESNSKLNEKIQATKMPSELTREDPQKILSGLDKQQISQTMSYNQDTEKQLDADLDEMDKYIIRLKCLGIALYEEIEYSNNLIDSIQNKVDGADGKICKLNKKMDKQLRK